MADHSNLLRSECYNPGPIRLTSMNKPEDFQNRALALLLAERDISTDFEQRAGRRRMDIVADMEGLRVVLEAETGFHRIVTSIITALVIGVDYTIHIIHCYREEYARDRKPEGAAIQTLSTTGSALLGSALTTALGLGVLIASPLSASQQFGFTAAITIVYSLVVAVLVVPPLMTVWGAYQNMRRWAQELDEAIEAVHGRGR